MGESEADQQRVRCEVVQRVFAKPDQGFHQRRGITRRFGCKPVGFIFVMTTPRIGGDPEQDPQRLNQKGKQDQPNVIRTMSYPEGGK